MKMKKIGNKKLGKGLIITGGILTAIGTIGAIVSKFSKDEENNYGSIDVCESVEFENGFIDEDDEFESEVDYEDEVSEELV